MSTAGGYLQKSRVIRNAEKNINDALFATNFNSSYVYATAGREGDALVSVSLAIEYPKKYKNEKNWFSTSANVKVA